MTGCDSWGEKGVQDDSQMKNHGNLKEIGNPTKLGLESIASAAVIISII